MKLSIARVKLLYMYFQAENREWSVNKVDGYFNHVFQPLKNNNIKKTYISVLNDCFQHIASLLFKVAQLTNIHFFFKKLNILNILTHYFVNKYVNKNNSNQIKRSADIFIFNSISNYILIHFNSKKTIFES